MSELKIKSGKFRIGNLLSKYSCGKTKNLAVIGWPIAHSLSPAMQNAAIAAAGGVVALMTE